MKNFYCFLLLLFAGSSVAQNFNRSFLDAPNHYLGGIEIVEDETFFLVNSAEGFLTAPSLYKFDSSGAIQAQYSAPQVGEYLGGTELQTLPDGRLLVYGNYSTYCDALEGRGVFFITLDQQLNQLDFVQLPDSSGGWGELIRANGTYYIFGNGLLTELDLNFAPVRQDTLPGTANAASPQLIFIDSSQVLLVETDAQNDHILYNLSTELFQVVLNETEHYRNINDSLFFSWKAGNSKLKIFEKQGLQAVDSVDLAPLLPFYPDEVRAAEDHLFFEKDEEYAIIAIDDLSLVETGQLYTEPGSNSGRSIAYGGSRFVVATTVGDDQVHIEARHTGVAPADIFGDLDMKAKLLKADLTVDSSMGGGYVVTAGTEWEVTVTNNSPQVLQNLSLVASGTLAGGCSMPGQHFLYTQQNLVPGDSTTLRIDNLGYQNFSATKEFDVFVRIRPAAANNNIISDVDMIHQVHTVTIGLEKEHPLAFDIYPNPVGSHLQGEIAAHEDVVVTIYDVAGKEQVAFSRRAHQSRALDVDVSFLPAGIYLLKIESGNDSSTQSFVKL